MAVANAARALERTIAASLTHGDTADRFGAAPADRRAELFDQVERTVRVEAMAFIANGNVRDTFVDAAVIYCTRSNSGASSVHRMSRGGTCAP